MSRVGHVQPGFDPSDLAARTATNASNKAVFERARLERNLGRRLPGSRAAAFPSRRFDTDSAWIAKETVASAEIRQRRSAGASLKMMKDGKPFGTEDESLTEI